MEVYIGTSGYFYWDWKGRFYPEELKPSEWFDYYMRYFNTLEINSTFYRFPKSSTMKNWYKNSKEDFLFSVKVNKTVTHLKKFRETKNILDDFYSTVLENLKEKLAAFLFQLPPSLKYSPQKLQQIIFQLDSRFLNVLEFRHESWFNEDVYRKLSENRITLCCISAPRFNDVCEKTTDIIYVRFHGKDNWYRYKYKDEELKLWVDRIVELSPKRVFIYFNNTYRAYAVENALKIKEMFEKT